MTDKNKKKVPVRKGARTRKAIKPEVLRGLNSGELETMTHVEGLAISFAKLLPAVIPDIPEEAVARLRVAASKGITKRMVMVAEELVAARGLGVFAELVGHTSDTVRGWAAHVLALDPDMNLEDRLAAIRPLADDPHPSVREWAWLAVRDHIKRDLDTALRILATWVHEDSANLRRFAVEATRPQGVGSKHLNALKEDPARGLPILIPLRADKEKYVREAVGNWLNDAAQGQPEWVHDLCAEWRDQSESEQTLGIITRALRNVPMPVEEPEEGEEDAEDVDPPDPRWRR